MFPKFKDLVGEKFGKLTVLSFNSRDKIKNKTYWNCVCDCGTETRKASVNLLAGKTKSCGCLISDPETKSKMAARMTTHGMYGTKEYGAWVSMFSRCTNENNIHYNLYGGIGTGIDEAFIGSFENFIAEVGLAPEPKNKYSLDRINNILGYIKGNLRWAIQETQNRNRSIPKNNTTGIIGVHWNLDKGKYTYCVAGWREIVDGKSKKKLKCFSVSRYGLLPSFAMACAYRENKIKELNLAGYNYSENHGKPKVKILCSSETVPTEDGFNEWIV